jgi:CBS domain containing-hemolysin-like protein
MKTAIVKELMVPIEEYATVSQGANLYEAVLALEKAQMAFDPSKHKHRAILVLDSKKIVVGKLDIFDILMALEPKYGELEATGVLSSSGYSPDLIKDMLKDRVFWSEPLQFVCSRAIEMNVKDFMETPTDCAYVVEDATLDEAIHQLLLCRYQSLLVTREAKVVGVLRLSDVFSKICDKIKTCDH